MADPVRFGSIMDALRHWASVMPDKKAWTFLDDRGKITDSISYKGLDDATTALAAELLSSHHISPGDRALLVFFPGLDFTVAVIACFKAGIIAVPVFPPDPRKLEKDLHHFVSIQSNSGAKIALSHQKYNHLKKVADIKQFFSMKGHKWPDLRWIQVDRTLEPFKGDYSSGEGKRVAENALTLPTIGEEVAFLQYTSGSTSEPKGVIISHANLVHNESLIQTALQTDTATVNVSWLPQYHDMGLIGSYLGAVWCGASGYYISPISFLKDPLVWVKAMSEFKATHTQAPNFAFALTSRKYRESVSRRKVSAGGASSERIDLSAMQHMINAAEPVDMNALLAFYEDFTPCGLTPGVIVPTFGLAEHCVYVCSCEPRHFVDAASDNGHTTQLHNSGVRFITCSKADLEVGTVVVSAPSEDATDEILDRLERSLVSCGNPSKGDGVSVLIVDPVSLAKLEEGKVGEIWINSASKACGYWGHPELSAEEFHATPTDAGGVADPVGAGVEVASEEEAVARQAVFSATESAGKDGYLRTGDLGFLWANELFICGRLKDLIIVRGTNHYPQDIERSVESAAPRLRAGCTAAFSCDNESGESLVFVAEVRESAPRETLEEICDICKTTVVNEHGVRLSSVCLLKPRTIPKTTSGKIARSWCKRAYLSNPSGLEVIYRWDAPSGPDNDDEKEVVTPKVAVGAQEVEMVPSGVASKEDYARVAEDDDGGDARDLEAIRAMSAADLQQELEVILCDLVSRVGGDLSRPVDPQMALVLLGMDSMSVIQFKGVLDNRYKCNIPDEYMFTTLASLDSLVKAVKHGGLTEEQMEAFAAAESPQQGSAGDRDERVVPVVERSSEPLCPWFTCCY